MFDYIYVVCFVTIPSKLFIQKVCPCICRCQMQYFFLVKLTIVFGSIQSHCGFSATNSLRLTALSPESWNSLIIMLAFDKKHIADCWVQCKICLPNLKIDIKGKQLEKFNEWQLQNKQIVKILVSKWIFQIWKKFMMMQLPSYMYTNLVRNNDCFFFFCWYPPVHHSFLKNNRGKQIVIFCHLDQFFCFVIWGLPSQVF